MLYKAYSVKHILNVKVNCMGFSFFSLFSFIFLSFKMEVNRNRIRILLFVIHDHIFLI